MTRELIHGQKRRLKMSKQQEKLIEQFRKNKLLKKYMGIADAHGIESFISEREYKKDPFPFNLRAMANRQRHAVMYVAELQEHSVKLIKDKLNEKDYVGALNTLKKEHVTIGFPMRNKDEYMKSWELIPNPKLDPWRS